MQSAVSVMEYPPQQRLVPVRIGMSDIPVACRAGWRVWRANWLPSSICAVPFAVLGLVLVVMAAELGLAPMAWIMAAGFLFVGPLTLIVFLGVACASREGRRAGAGDIKRGWREAPAGMFGLAAVLTFILLIWVADASILYGFVVGGAVHHWADLLPHSPPLAGFQLRATFMGAAFATIVFPVSAYSVLLLLDRRVSLVAAVSASVRAVLASVPAHLVWAFMLAVTVIVSVALPPALVVSLPLLAHASEALYRRVFP